MIERIHGQASIRAPMDDLADPGQPRLRVRYIRLMEDEVQDPGSTPRAEPDASPAGSPEPVGRTIVALIRDGVVDAELAALAWVLGERRVPMIVAAPDGASAPGEELAAALAMLVPANVGRAALGTADVAGDPATDAIIAGVLTGGALRRAMRGVARGFGLVACVGGGSLEQVLARLGDFSVGATPEMIGRLGMVVVLGESPPHRVVAAHYLRPVARDAGGHVQRLAPAVLAAWDTATSAWDHFAWGIYPELAHRVGQPAGDVERAHGERTEILATMARAGAVDAAQVLATLGHARGHQPA